MTPRKAVSALAAALLLQPPVAAEARVLIVPACGGEAQRVVIPGDPADPDHHQDCAKACHAVNERRGKSAAVRRCC